MKLFPPELKIEIGKDGFDDFNTLGRKDFGTKLSALLTVVTDPVVIAIDGGWGSGKTVFLKCWVGEHMMRAENADQVIYFDAFANDFLDDPLVSLISALSSGSKKPAKSKIKKLKQTVIALAGPAARIALAAASAGTFEIVGAIAGAAIRETKAEAAKAVDEFWKREDGRRAAMKQFGELLGEFAGTSKLIFVIDELDRCRPDYALTLLETIKHFFAVENVHFVLGVNLAELANIVKARYGDSTDAQTYLQKFIHLTMTLPARAGPNPAAAVGLVHFENISKEMEIPSQTRSKILSYLQVRTPPPSLRDVERLATYAALVAPTLENETGGVRAVICGAADLKALNCEVYAGLLADSVDLADVASALPLPFSKGTRPIAENVIAWARFLDLSVWRTADNNVKRTMFLSEFLNDKPVRIDTFLAKYLETFQLPEPPSANQQ